MDTRLFTHLASVLQCKIQKLTISHLRVGDETLTVPRYGGALVGPDPLRQVFNDTAAEVPGTSSARRRNWSF